MKRQILVTNDDGISATVHAHACCQVGARLRIKNCPVHLSKSSTGFHTENDDGRHKR